MSNLIQISKYDLLFTLQERNYTVYEFNYPIGRFRPLLQATYSWYDPKLGSRLGVFYCNRSYNLAQQNKP